MSSPVWANTGVVFRELSFSRLECGVHDRLHIYPLCGIFYFPWHRHQIEGTNGFYCLIRKTERFTISNVESQVFTPNNSRLDPGSNPGCPRDKRMSYHWTNCASPGLTEHLCRYPDILHWNLRKFMFCCVPKLRVIAWERNVSSCPGRNVLPVSLSWMELHDWRRWTVTNCPSSVGNHLVAVDSPRPGRQWGHCWANTCY